MTDNSKIGQYDRLARILSAILDEAAVERMEAVILQSNNISDDSGSTRGMANPMRAAGDMIYGGTSGVARRLPIGTNGEVLTLVAGIPSWEAGSGGGGPVFWDLLTNGDPVNTELVFAGGDVVWIEV